jgi:hypothetical protein
MGSGKNVVLLFAAILGVIACGIAVVVFLLGAKLMSRKDVGYISDAVAIALVTFAGFAFHGETDASILPRFLLSYVPLTVAWFIIAPLLGLYQPEITSNPKQLWRPALAMIFAAPLAALLARQHPRLDGDSRFCKRPRRHLRVGDGRLAGDCNSFKPQRSRSSLRKKLCALRVTSTSSVQVLAVNYSQ